MLLAVRLYILCAIGVKMGHGTLLAQVPLYTFLLIFAHHVYCRTSLTAGEYLETSLT